MAHGVSDQFVHVEPISSLYGKCIFYYDFNPSVIGKSRFIMHHVIGPMSMFMHLGLNNCRGKD